MFDASIDNSLCTATTLTERVVALKISYEKDRTMTKL